MSFVWKNFRIQIQNILLPEEQKNLTLLYQPLVGSNALGLYNTLYFLHQTSLSSNSKQYMHQFLFDILNIDAKKFLKIKEKLEIVNLLDTFENSLQEKIYVLHSPLKEKKFFQDPILNQFLLSEVGEVIYTNLQSICLTSKNQIDLKSYKKISKTFPEIYNFKKINLQKTILHYTKTHSSDNQKNLIFQQYFEYESFINGLPERFQQPFLLEWKNIDFITKIAFIYEIKPKEMISLYQESFQYNYEEEVDLSILTTTIKRKYLKKDKIKIVNTKDFSDKENEMIFYLKNTHPHRIINTFGKSKFFCSSLYDIVLSLHNKNNVENGVINALLMYVFKLKPHHNNIVPAYNYFQTILNSWLQKGIISTETAYDFLMEEQKNYHYTKNKQNNPKWLDDAKKELILDN
ncbi:DnaD domain protein [Candidatus Phytoplasma phoenicium]|uniref:Replication initiation and membrane attachment n=1 Tax=Candidatus Phytoplasma phoenicium TaxID=198422 RepID=A0A0L0MK23_9MOLU|nr:DnaD domain protein [Candidatus Phytoplasma phoenicium]KND62640.1 Replication initiation and membrane attachment [Candidatus Phytoplasma phoenicium]